jgi:UDPglucose 6-dehydrogenase
MSEEGHIKMARIVVIGSGVVGTATGSGFARAGHDTTFVDIDEDRIAALRSAGFRATNVVDLDGPAAFVFLSLPTPHVGRSYDLTAFEAGLSSVGAALASCRSFHTVIVRSTVPPGTCEGLVKERLQQVSGKVAGTDFALASAPEFLRAASALEDFIFPWMTVIASRSRRTVERIEELFAPFGGEIQTFSDPRIAEMIKCSHNVFNAAKISFWNEMWRVCTALGIDAQDVGRTVARSAEGSTNPNYGIRGGAPYGGACLPKDVAGFLGLADSLGIDVPLVEGVAQVNGLMQSMLEARSAPVATNGKAGAKNGSVPDLVSGNVPVGTL